MHTHKYTHKTVVTGLFSCVYLCVCIYVYVCGDQKTRSGVVWYHLSCSETKYLISLGAHQLS